MGQRMANPVLGGEEDTSEDNANLENKSSEQKEEEKKSVEDQTQAGEIKTEEIPYHKDKRWIEMYEKSKKFDDLETETMTLKEKIQLLESKQSSEPLKVPESFKRLFGDDEDVYKIWKSEQDEREKSLRADILREIQEGKQQEVETQQKEEKEWQEYFDAEISSLKEDGFDFDEDKLTKFVLDNEITDSKGVYDLKKGLLKMQNQIKTNPARKAIADMTGGGKSTEVTKKEYMTSEDFKGSNRPW